VTRSMVGASPSGYDIMKFVVEVLRSTGGRAGRTLHRVIIDTENRTLAAERADAFLADWAARGARVVRVLDAKDREEVYRRAK